MTSGDRLYLGIDGGGSGCRARLCDAGGRTLGAGRGGSANITTDLEGATRSIAAATAAALDEAGLEQTALSRIHAVFGMAGGNSPTEARALADRAFGFAAQAVTSDAEIACIGAHGGRDGAILILGTGSQGYGRRKGQSYRVGGWGFALSDGASGAVIGHRAARRALLAHEGLAPRSPFTDAVMASHGNSETAMLAWALKAVPRDWAELAPQLFSHAAAGDPVAVALRQDAVAEVEGLIDRLAALGAERVTLVGGLAPSYRPHLATRFATLLTEAVGDALDGALLMARGEVRP